MICSPKISYSILLMNLSQDSLCVLETVVLDVFFLFCMFQNFLHWGFVGIFGKLFVCFNGSFDLLIPDS